MGAFSPTRHPNRPPEVQEIIEVLRRLRVEFVLAGSVAALVHGVEVEPGDVDVVPDLDRGNLARLIDALKDLEAAPQGPFGSWSVTDAGAWKWMARPTTDQELAEWTPDARNVESLDHLFVTRLGNFDVVPRIAGTYEMLRPRAAQHSWRGCHLHVACVDDLLARLTEAGREKDRRRLAALQALRRRD